MKKNTERNAKKNSTFDGPTALFAARVMATLNADMENAALVMVEPHDGERFLVVGFGPGVGLVALLDAITPAHVLAVDPSDTMVRAARRRLARHPKRGLVELLAVPAIGIPAVGPFDAAVAVNSEQLWEPHADTVRVVSEVLRPGGRLVTLTHSWAIEKHRPRAEWKASVVSDLKAHGFGEPEWEEAKFRSGHALGMRTSKVACALSEENL